MAWVFSFSFSFFFRFQLGVLGFWGLGGGEAGWFGGEVLGLGFKAVFSWGLEVGLGVGEKNVFT